MRPSKKNEHSRGTLYRFVTSYLLTKDFRASINVVDIYQDARSDLVSIEGFLVLPQTA